MANQDKENPTTGAETDISKAQSQQQPPNQASQEKGGQQNNPQFGEAEPFESGQSADQPDAGLERDTLSKQRTDVEGASFSKEKGETESGFVGAEGQRDTSSELVEDQDFDEGGEGAPEGK